MNQVLTDGKPLTEAKMMTRIFLSLLTVSAQMLGSAASHAITVVDHVIRLMYLLALSLQEALLQPYGNRK